MSRLKTAMAMEPPDIDSEDDADDIGLQAGSSRLEPIDAEPGLRVTPRATSFGSQLDSPDIPLLAMLEEELGRVATPALDYEFSAPSLPRLKSSASFKSMGTSTSSRGRPPSRNDTRQFFQEVFDAEMKAPSLFDAEIRPEPASDSDGSPVTRRPRASKRSEAIARSKQKRQLKSYMKHLKQLLAGEPAALELLGDGAALEMLLDAVTTTLGDPDDLLLLDAAGVMDILYSICIGTSKSDRSEAMEEFLEACRRSEAGLPPAPSRGRGKDRGSTGRAKGNSKEETALEQVYNGGRRGRRTVKSEDRRVPDGNGSCDATASANDSSSSLSDDEYRRLGDSTDLSDLSPKPAASSSTSEVWIDSSDGAGPSSGFLRRPIVQRRISRTKDGQIVTQGRRRVQAEPPTPTREPIPTAEFFVSPGARAASNRIQTPGFAVDPDSLDELPASSTGRRRPRPRYRNPRHSSPYHLVPEEQSMQADPDGPNPDGRTCRICLSEDNWISMLAPCACDGSAKWVHRVCLARWRKTATNVLSKVCLSVKERIPPKNSTLSGSFLANRFNARFATLIIVFPAPLPPSTALNLTSH